jgi:hypothetical protein
MAHSSRALTPSRWQFADLAGDDLIRIADFDHSAQILIAKGQYEKADK